MRWLEVKIPPLAVVIVATALMWLVARAIPGLGFPLPARHLCVLALAIAGAATAIAGVVSFRMAKTTVSPLQPQRASSLVVGGVYRFTRNPMYLGMLALMLSWAAYLANAGALLLVPGFVLFLNRFQIEPEERALRAIFGTEFDDYQRRVRRWL